MKEQLAYSIDRSLTWLHRHLPYFTLPACAHGEDPIIEASRKRIGELSLALSILARHKPLLDDYRVRDIIAHIQAIVASEAFYFNMSRNLELFPFYLTVLNGLRSVGVVYPDYDFCLQQILDARFMDTIERNNWQKIDFVHGLDFAGLRHRMPPLTELYQTSSLFYRPSAAHVRTIDVYGITHIIFHLSSFGTRDMARLLGNDYEPVQQYVVLLTGLYDHYQDYDLLAELLICCHNLQHRRFPLFATHWHSLLGSQTPTGDFTSRYLRKATPGQLADPEYVFNYNYHPTLVALFACILEYKFLTDNEYYSATH